MDTASILIRVGVSIVMLFFGFHQFFKPKSWSQTFMPRWIVRTSPLSEEGTMRLHSAGNLVLGFLLLTTLFGFIPYIISWIVLFWWVAILPFAFRGQWADGMRDTAIIFALIANLVLLYAK